MSPLQTLRLLHLAIASGAALAYMTGEMGFTHLLMGYWLTAALIVRIGWGLSGPRATSLARFVPRFTISGQTAGWKHPAIGRLLLLALALCLLTVTVTGLAIDPVLWPAIARGPLRRTILAVHEVSSDVLLGLVLVHIVYFLAVRREMVLFMLFTDTTAPPRDDAATGA